MLGKHIRRYRLKNSFSKKELAEKLGVNVAVISEYEKDTKMLDLKTARLLATVLGIKLSELMNVSAEHKEYEHCEFRKRTALNKSCQEYINLSVEEYFDKIFSLFEILEEYVLREPPLIHCLRVTGEAEIDATQLRDLLGFAQSGAVRNIVDTLENKGILVYAMKYEHNSFSGVNGVVEGRPFIVINASMTAERQRSTLVHELVHIFFERPDADFQAWEEYVERVSGAFLFPAPDVIGELGKRRSVLSADMVMIAQEYGISMQMLMKRAHQLRIISEQMYTAFNISLNKSGNRRREGGRIPVEEPKLYEQLVLRAYGEERITLSRAAELLEISNEQMQQKVNNEEIYY